MAKVMQMVIGECQHAFAVDRQILNTALITNEVVDSLPKGGKRWLSCKHAMEKAYDYVTWSFLLIYWIDWVRRKMVAG